MPDKRIGKDLSPAGAVRVASALSHWMREKEMTDVELAKVVGIPRTTLRTYLSGSLKTLSLDKLEKMAHALGKTLSDIFSYSENLRGFFKVETPAGKYEILNLGKYKIRIALESPMNPYHAHGLIYFSPGAHYLKKDESETDIWLYLKSEGGIITLDYNGQKQDIKGGDRILLNARHPFSLSYLADERNRRKLHAAHESDRQIVCSFSSSPPFWLF